MRQMVWQYTHVEAASVQVWYLTHRFFLTSNSSQTGIQGFGGPYVKTKTLPCATTCDWQYKDYTNSWFLNILGFHL